MAELNSMVGNILPLGTNAPSRLGPYIPKGLGFRVILVGEKWELLKNTVARRTLGMIIPIRFLPQTRILQVFVQGHLESTKIP